MRRWEVDLTSHEQWIYLFIYIYISRCLELCIGGCWRNRSGVVTYLRRAGGKSFRLPFCFFVSPSSFRGVEWARTRGNKVNKVCEQRCVTWVRRILPDFLVFLTITYCSFKGFMKDPPSFEKTCLEDN